MSDFVGRRSYITTLETELDKVRQTGRGRFVSMRGRRRVGKSRLVDEFFIGVAGLRCLTSSLPPRDSRSRVSSRCLLK